MASILLIDDDCLVRKIVSERLSSEHTVFTVADWSRAHQYLFKNPVDLILMDVEMPGVNGDKIARVLKESFFSKPLKIALFSSLDADILEKKVEESGADGFIEKTFHKETLLYKVDSFLENSFSAGGGSIPTAIPVAKKSWGG